MITALISAITGLVSGVAPDLLKEFRETRAANREMEFLKLNNQLALERAKLEAGMKLEESHSAQLMAEAHRYRLDRWSQCPDSSADRADLRDAVCRRLVRLFLRLLQQ
jgi:hypothetical protein